MRTVEGCEVGSRYGITIEGRKVGRRKILKMGGVGEEKGERRSIDK
mgnify:CR=1 FL=1